MYVILYFHSSYLHKVLFQQTVNPGLSYFHGSHLIGDVTAFDEDHLQLRKLQSPKWVGKCATSCAPGNIVQILSKTINSLRRYINKKCKWKLFSICVYIFTVDLIRQTARSTILWMQIIHELLFICTNQWRHCTIFRAHTRHCYQIFDIGGKTDKDSCRYYIIMSILAEIVRSILSDITSFSTISAY